MSAAIQLRSVTKSYARGGEELRVLDELDLDMDNATFYALMGPSGSGKTTLLNLVGGLDHADSGAIQIGADDLAAMDSGELAQWRSEQIGFVFQGFNLLPVLSAIAAVLPDGGYAAFSTEVRGDMLRGEARRGEATRARRM